MSPFVALKIDDQHERTEQLARRPRRTPPSWRRRRRDRSRRGRARRAPRRTRRSRAGTARSARTSRRRSRAGRRAADRASRRPRTSTYCHPSYAQRTPIIAAPAPDEHRRRSSRPARSVATSCHAVAGDDQRAARSTATHATLMPVASSPRSRSAARAANVDDRDDGDHHDRNDLRAASGRCGKSWPRYSENATASVATDPLAMTRKLVHP